MSSSRPAYHHGDLARALEAAAMQLLSSRPAQQISLREVARAANVSHNAPYHHFADRQGLLKTLAERSMSALVDQVREAVAEPEPVTALIAGGQAYIRFALERPHAFDVIYDPTVCLPGSPTETMAPLIRELESLIGDAAVTAGLRRDDLTAVWGLVHGLGTLAAAGHFSLDVAMTSSERALRLMIAR